VDKGSISEQVLKMLDSTNARIVVELLKSPTISSLSLAKRLNIPFSTLQRRGARIEKYVGEDIYF
jgi:DNA-binding Lrp family transcriptional regulator